MPRFLAALLLYCYAALTSADQLIIEPDRGRAPILQAINKAEHTVSLTMYGMTDDALIDALIRQKMKGKTVRIILEKHPYKAETENHKAIRKLNQAGVNWQGTAPNFNLTHQKTLLIDDKKAIVMTFNFTRSAFKNDRNFALVIDDPKRTRDIANVFAADWNHVPTNHHSPDLIFSPDNSRDRLLVLIREAKQSIKIYAQSLNDYKIVGALAKAAHNGVRVEVLTSSKIRDKQAAYLSRAGVQIYRSSNRYIHAKVMIFDNRKAVIGSINLTRNSLDNNRELAVVTEDKTVLKQLNTVFDQDKPSRFGGFSLPDQRTILRFLRKLERML